MRTLSLLLALLLTVPGCSLLTLDRDDGIACTLEYRMLTVDVVDGTGAPADGLTSTVTRVRTGEVLTFSEGPDDVAGPGTYFVATDAHTALLDARGETLRFRAEGRGLVAEADFVVAGGPCHIEKQSGPERIVARSE